MNTFHFHPCRTYELEGVWPVDCLRRIPCDHPGCHNEPCGIFCDPCFERECTLHRKERKPETRWITL